jgi:magnesium chelatase subunit D
LLPRVHLDEALLQLITGICTDFGVDGLRADIAMYRAAVTLAAYEGRTVVCEDDVRRVARLVLPHRRRRQPFDQSTVDDQELEESLERHRPPQNGGQSSPPPPDTHDGETTSPPEGQTEPSPDGPAPDNQQARIGQSFAVRPLEGSVRQDLLQRTTGRRSRTLGGPTGHYVTSRPPLGRVRDIALDATLRAAAPHLRRRQREGGSGLALQPTDLREKVRESRVGNLILFVVDASGSMGARERMVATKGAILSLLLDAYQKRDRVGLVSFRGHEATVLLPPTSSVELAERHLAELRTGGRTPLAAGLAKAYELLMRFRSRTREVQPLLVMLTDGRANASASGRDPMADALTQAAALHAARVPALVVDTEQGVLRLGLARQLAETLGGVCLRLEELAAGTLARVVKLSLAGGA